MNVMKSKMLNPPPFINFEIPYLGPFPYDKRT